MANTPHNGSAAASSTDAAVHEPSAPERAHGRVQLAVYDFDGTCITGNSPVMLVRHLMRKRMLRPTEALKIGAWAFCYKFRLPQNESWVRSLVFSAFEGQPQSQVDDYLAKFYDDEIACRFRPEADASMLEHKNEGCVVMVVSATWDAIIARAMEKHPFQFYVATRMKVDSSGNYTRLVDGLPVEGQEKISAIKRFADGKYGAGNWELAYAYGDHHSDLPLLEAARTPHAVTPDNPLERAAKRRGWAILKWEKIKNREEA